MLALSFKKYPKALKAGLHLDLLIRNLIKHKDHSRDLKLIYDGFDREILRALGLDL